MTIDKCDEFLGDGRKLIAGHSYAAKTSKRPWGMFMANENSVAEQGVYYIHYGDLTDYGTTRQNQLTEPTAEELAEIKKSWNTLVRTGDYGPFQRQQLMPSAIEALIAAATRLSAVEKQLQWQPISTAPKDGTPVLLAWTWSTDIHSGAEVVLARWICRKHSHLSRHRDCPNESDCDMGWDHYDGTMTHWMPLPSSPPSAPSSTSAEEVERALGQ